MKIKMRTTAASATGCLQSGQSYDVPESIGGPLIDGGYAEQVIAAKPTAAPTKEDAPIERPERRAPETAERKPAAETAQSPDEPPRPKRAARKSRKS